MRVAASLAAPPDTGIARAMPHWREQGRPSALGEQFPALAHASDALTPGSANAARRCTDSQAPHAPSRGPGSWLFCSGKVFVLHRGAIGCPLPCAVLPAVGVHDRRPQGLAQTVSSLASCLSCPEGCP